MNRFEQKDPALSSSSGWEQRSILADEERVIRLCLELERQIDVRRPHPEDFYQVYGENECVADLKKVSDIKNEFVHKTFRAGVDQAKVEHDSRLASIAENLLIKNISEHGWFGENAVAIPTHDFDDYVGGVDFVVEFYDEQNPSTYAGLSIDATFSKNPAIVNKKLDRIKDECEVGKVAEVKYFSSYQFDRDTPPEFMGIIKTPRAVVVIHPKLLAELMQLESDKNSEIKSHITQVVVLNQIKFQYEQLIKIAQKKNFIGSVASIYAETLDKVKTILASDRIQKITKQHPDIVKNDIGLRIMKDYFQYK